MIYTLGEAVKATGVSKTSLHRAIRSGRISATKTENGSYEIDASELFRVFPLAARNSSEEQPLDQGGTTEVSSGTGALRRELEMLRQERERERGQLQAQIEDLKRRLDQSEQERRGKDQQLSAATALLTDQRRRGWMWWWRR
jgi:hypothetical protein